MHTHTHIVLEEVRGGHKNGMSPLTDYHAYTYINTHSNHSDNNIWILRSMVHEIIAQGKVQGWGGGGGGGC